MTAELAAPPAHLHLLDSVFAGEHRRSVDIAAGRSVVQALSEHWPAEWDAVSPPELVVVVNGRIEPDPWRMIEPGDHVAAYPRSGIPIPAFIIAAAAAVGVSATTVALIGTSLILSAISFGVSLLLAPDAPDVPQGHNERQNYAWAGVSTEYRGYGAIMPAVFGSQILGGTVISYSVASRGNKSVLRLLLCLGHGPFESIAGSSNDLDGVSGDEFADPDFRLNGTPVRQWGGAVKVSTRMGRVNQTAIRGMNDEERTYTVGLRLKGPAAGQAASLANAKEYLTRTPVNAALLRFTFTEGLVWINGDGDYLTQAVKFRVRYWRTAIGRGTADSNVSEWEFPRFTGKTTSPLPRDYLIEFPSLDSYTLEIDRVTDEPITTEGLASKSKSELSQVVEIVNRDLEYPGLALVGLEITAVDGLAGGRPDAEVPVRAIRCLIPDEDDQDGTHTRTWTRSPFWVTYHLLRDTDYGLGGTTRYMRFDVAEWRAGSEHAAELVDAELESTLALAAASGALELRLASAAGFAAGDIVLIEMGEAGEEQVTISGVASGDRLLLDAPLSAAHAKGVTVSKVHARYEWDGVIDGSASPWDTIQQILSTARARLVQQGNDFILIRAVPRDPVMLICEGNGADDFVETRENERLQPNALDLQFWNRDKRYERDNQLVIAEDAIVDNVSDATFFDREQLNAKSEQALGITRPEQINRHGRYRLRQLRRAPRGWACTLPLEAVVARVGNVVDVAHRVVLTATWSGRVIEAVSSGGATIKLDQPVTLEAATTYAIEVRVGTSTVATRTIASAAGSYARGATLAIVGTWPGDVAEGAVYALGLQGQETVAAEIVAYALQDDFRVVVATKEYVEDALADV